MSFGEKIYPGIQRHAEKQLLIQVPFCARHQQATRSHVEFSTVFTVGGNTTCSLAPEVVKVHFLRELSTIST